jgi:hypothetical protein
MAINKGEFTGKSDNDDVTLIESFKGDVGKLTCSLEDCRVLATSSL